MPDSTDGVLHTMDQCGLQEFISTKEGLLTIVEQLRGGGKQRLEYNEVHSIVYELIKRAGRIYQIYNLPKKLEVIRAREFKYPEEKETYTVADLGPPPPAKVGVYGRCHAPGKPVFYCSLYMDIALSEVKAEKNRYYAISRYEIDPAIRLLPIGELDQYRRTGDTYLGEAASKSHEVYKEIVERDGVLPILIDAFFAEEFIGRAADSADYRITSAISEVLFEELNQHSPPDALYYPSVAFRGGENFAFSLSAFKSKMHFKDAEVIRIKEQLGYGIYEYEKVLSGIIDVASEKVTFS